MFTDLITMLSDFDKDSKDLFDLPKYNVETDKNTKILTVLLPGFDKSEIKITEIENGVRVTTSRKAETTLIKNVDVEFNIPGYFERITAKYENGVLQVFLEKDNNPEQTINIE